MILLELIVVIVGVGTEFQFLHLDHVLLSLGFVLLLLVLVLPLAVIHRLGDGRLGGGRDQDQIQAEFLRLANGRQRGQDLDGPVGKHRAHFTHANRLVYVFPNLRPARGISGRIH